MLLCLMLFGISAVLAQDDDTDDTQAPPVPLAEMMALVPDTDATRGAFLYYADYRALEDSRDYLPSVDSAEEWVEALDGFYLGHLFRLAQTPSEFTNSWLNYAAIPERMGFGVFDVDRTLDFGNPPAIGTVWQGEFDQEAITAAHTEERDYITAEVAGITAVCQAAGCESRLEFDPAANDRTNLFDLLLQRPVPFLLLPDALISVGESALLPTVAETVNAERASLYDDPAYRLIVDALTQNDDYDGDLIQAQIIPQNDFLQRAVDFDDAASVAELPRLLQPVGEPGAADVPAWARGYGELIPYNLAALADIQDGDTQLAVIALQYEDIVTAERATFELERRVIDFANTGLAGRNQPLVERFDGTVSTFTYTDAESLRGVAVVVVRYPNPPVAEEFPPDGGQPSTPAGGYYQELYSALGQGTLYLLWDVRAVE